MMAQTADQLSALEGALATAQGEGISPNFRRWCRFAGVREWVELQALHVHERYGQDRSYVAHASTSDVAIKLLREREQASDCPGIYTVANKIDPAVATRQEPGKWHPAAKGSSTTDREIRARTVLFVDVDAVRPKATSATEREMHATAVVAQQIHAELSRIIESDTPLGYGHSGNGRAVFIALDFLSEEKAGPLVKGILTALSLRFSTAEAEIDTAVSDAKRLVPAFGTIKRKGATGIAERPHRTTAFVCAEDVDRIGLVDLERVLATLREDLDDAGRGEVDRAMGIRTKAPEPKRPSPSGDSPFVRANAVPVADVLSWLGKVEGDRPICPGCGESDSGVAVVGNGLKCSHKRCAAKGVPGREGFRTPVDLVAEVQHIEPKEAVRVMAERFGFEGFATKAPGTVAADPQPSLNVWTPVSVIESWRAEGPLVHEPTGIAKLDELTAGGPVYGSRWYIIGAPDAGKTGLIIQMADTYARRGIAVGVLAVDEEPSDTVTRFAQRAGYLRRDCELRDPTDLALMAEKLADLPIRLYGPEHTIESAAADLDAYARERGLRAAIFADSIQAVRCVAAADAKTAQELVSRNVAAMRNAATNYRMIAVATSEMNRNAYRNIDSAETSNDMAAGKESGAIEFSARVMIAMRSVKNEPDLLELRIAKNKHGPGGDRVHLRIDRRHMVLTEATAPDEADLKVESRKQNKAEVAADADALAQVIRKNQGVGSTDLRGLIRADGHKWGVEKLNAAMTVLKGGFNGVRIVDRSTSKACAWHLVAIESGGNE